MKSSSVQVTETLKVALKIREITVSYCSSSVRKKQDTASKTTTIQSLTAQYAECTLKNKTELSLSLHGWTILTSARR